MGQFAGAYGLSAMPNGTIRRSLWAYSTNPEGRGVPEIDITQLFSHRHVIVTAQ
jgi:hypothetical protein